MIYTDVQNVFDSVSHYRLIKTQYKTHNDLISSFKEFLNGRTQKVVVNKTFSDLLPVFSGVPQGMVICPLLFILMMLVKKLIFPGI